MMFKGIDKVDCQNETFSSRDAMLESSAKYLHPEFFFFLSIELIIEKKKGKDQS